MTEPENRLWQAVLFKAFIDATAVNPQGQENIKAKREADVWIRRGGKDFRLVCSLAGFDHEFLREAYESGKIDPELLRAAEKEKVA